MQVLDDVEQAPRKPLVDLHHGTLVLASTLTANAANYLLHTLLIRQLGPTGYATVSALLAIVTIAGVLGVIGGTELTRAIARSRAISGNLHLRALADAGAKRTLAVSLASFALGLIVLLGLAGYLRISDRSTLVSAAVLIGLSVALPCMRGIFQGAERYVIWGSTIAGEGILRLLAAISLVALGFSATGALAGMSIGSAIALGIAVFGIASLGRRTNDAERLPASPVDFGMALSLVIITAYQVYDLVLAKHYLTAEQAGLYTAASIGGRILFMLVSTIPVILLPKTAHAFGRGTTTAFLLVRAVAATVVVAGLCLALFALFPRTMATAISGSGAREAGPLLVLYGLASSFIAGTYVVVTYRIGIRSMSFVPLLTVSLLAEAAALVMWHGDARTMLYVLIAGHAASFAVAFFGLEHG